MKTTFARYVSSSGKALPGRLPLSSGFKSSRKCLHSSPDKNPNRSPPGGRVYNPKMTFLRSFNKHSRKDSYKLPRNGKPNFNDPNFRPKPWQVARQRTLWHEGALAGKKGEKAKKIAEGREAEQLKIQLEKAARRNSYLQKLGQDRIQGPIVRVIQSIGSMLGKGVDVYTRSRRKLKFEPSAGMMRKSLLPKENVTEGMIAGMDRQTRLIRECRVMVLEHLAGQKLLGSPRKHARMHVFKRGTLQKPTPLIPPPNLGPRKLKHWLRQNKIQETNYELDFRTSVFQLQADVVKFSLELEKGWRMTQSWQHVYENFVRSIRHSAARENKVCRPAQRPVPTLPPEPKLPLKYELVWTRSFRPDKEVIPSRIQPEDRWSTKNKSTFGRKLTPDLQQKRIANEHLWVTAQDLRGPTDLLPVGVRNKLEFTRMYQNEKMDRTKGIREKEARRMRREETWKNMASPEAEWGENFKPEDTGSERPKPQMPPKLTSPQARRDRPWMEKYMRKPW